MTTLDQFRGGLGRAWDSLTEGWHQLRDRAAHALTRFQPGRGRDELETAEEQLAWHGSRWALLAAEVREDDTTVIVRMEVPGMEPNDFDIAVTDGRTLLVRGEKQAQREENRGRYTLLECAYGRFERAIELPAEVDDGKARAKYRRGILRIELPKVRQARRNRIPIQS